jgi:hypothetical protein
MTEGRREKAKGKKQKAKGRRENPATTAKRDKKAHRAFGSSQPSRLKRVP